MIYSILMIHNLYNKFLSLYHLFSTNFQLFFGILLFFHLEFYLKNLMRLAQKINTEINELLLVKGKCHLLIKYFHIDQKYYAEFSCLLV